jgi:hypothetical protein
VRDGERLDEGGLARAVLADQEGDAGRDVEAPLEDGRDPVMATT